MIVPAPDPPPATPPTQTPELRVVARVGVL
jgi:hypothetical protein